MAEQTDHFQQLAASQANNAYSAVDQLLLAEKLAQVAETDQGTVATAPAF